MFGLKFWVIIGLIITVTMAFFTYGEIRFHDGKAYVEGKQIKQVNKELKNENKRLVNRPRNLDDRIVRLQRWRDFVRTRENDSE